MKTYVVGYDLNKPGQNYTKLIERLQSYPNWWHYLDSTWVIKTDWTTMQLRDDLLPYIDKNDELLVVRLEGEGAWYGFEDKASVWLRDNLTLY